MYVFIYLYGVGAPGTNAIGMERMAYNYFTWVVLMYVINYTLYNIKVPIHYIVCVLHVSRVPMCTHTDYGVIHSTAVCLNTYIYKSAVM